jgi:hypothetical protein
MPSDGRRFARDAVYPIAGFSLVSPIAVLFFENASAESRESSSGKTSRRFMKLVNLRSSVLEILACLAVNTYHKY